MLLASWWLLNQLLDQSPLLIGTILAIEAIILAYIVAGWAADYVSQPISYLWQAILHVSPESNNTPAPNLQNSKLGRELITSLCLQVYQLASSSGAQDSLKTNMNDTRAHEIANNLPLPVIVMDNAQAVIFANEAALKYTGLTADNLIGKNFYEKLNLSFPTQDTLDSWLAGASAHNLTSVRSWEHVRLDLPGQAKPLQFDMAAYYNKQNPAGVETIVTIFDHTDSYTQQSDAIGFVTMVVHELRTPLTLLRGYIEVFEEELAGKLGPELSDFMLKMQASAQQLTAFVNNILNVAKVEDDQLVLQLHEENWNDIVTKVVNDYKLQASVKHKTIELQLAPGLPTVAADKVSAYEVLGNLLDNAIKYGGNSQKIVVKTALGDGGGVETNVQDFGVGITANILPHLFEKFYRNHRTQHHVGGTGLGLYLSKTIVSAHGGKIWIRSKDGQGTTVGFVLLPYAQLAGELKNSDNNEITRNAYGWIKNHSLYRK